MEGQLFELMEEQLNLVSKESEDICQDSVIYIDSVNLNIQCIDFIDSVYLQIEQIDLSELQFVF